MKHLLTTLSLLALGTTMAWAEQYTDANGVTWTYSYSSSNGITQATETGSTTYKYYAGISISGMSGNSSEVEVPAYLPYNGEDQPVIYLESSSNLFSGKSTVTSVVLPETLQGIGEFCFNDCEGLKEITLPKNVSYLYYTFNDCDNLETVQFNADRVYIGFFSFSFCRKLKSVSWKSATYIEENAFYNDYNLTQIGSLTDVKSIGANAFCNTHIETADLSSCTSLGNNAFQSNTALKQVILNPALTAIDEGVFNGCTSLDGITLPNALTGIGINAFKGCKSLSAITIPDGVVNIASEAFSGCTSLSAIAIPSQFVGEKAFAGCTALSDVTIGAAIKLIGKNAFADCTSLTSLNVAAGNSTYNTQDGVLFQTANKELSLYPTGRAGAYTIPTGTLAIGANAFSGCAGLTAVTIPTSVAEMGDGAFYGCTGLATVTMEAGSLTKISNQAFQGCTKLNQLMIPYTITELGNSAFYDCSGMEEIAVPMSVTKIGINAFYGCNVARFESSTPATLASSSLLSGLGFAAVPDAALDAYRTAPNWNSFQSQIVPIDTYKQEVTLTASTDGVPALLKAIGEKNLPNVVTLKVHGSMNSYDLLMIRNKMLLLRNLDISDVDMKGDPTKYEYYTGYYMTKNDTLGDYSFYKNQSLVSIKLPKTVKYIGYRAFSECPNLKNVEFGEDLLAIGDYAFLGSQKIENIAFNDNLGTIGNYAFGHDYTWHGQCNIKTIKFGKHLKKIGYAAFANNYHLKVLNFPEELTTIEGYAFQDCSGLEHMTLPVSLTSIGYYSFYGCRSLKELNIPAGSKTGLTTIPEYAFNGCSSLEEISIPSNITTIGDYAFAGCDNVKNVYNGIIKASDSNTKQNTFSCYHTAKLWVDDRSYFDYYVGTQWGQFINLDHMDMNTKFFYIKDGDYILREDEDRFENDPDIDIKGDGGFIIEGDEQDAGEVDITPDGSIVADDKLFAERLTVTMQIKANTWYFFCFPYDIDVADLETPHQNFTFRIYDGQQRADNNGLGGWKQFKGETLEAGVGYAFRSPKAGELKIPYYNVSVWAMKQDVQLQVYESALAADSNWNFVGNCQFCYFNGKDIDYDYPITIWDPDNKTYVTKTKDDDFTLHPFQAFFVQTPSQTEEIVFDVDSRMTKTQSDVKVEQQKAMRRAKGIDQMRVLVDLQIMSADSLSDRTRVVFNDEKASTYELTTDASKFMSLDETVAQIYTLDNRMNRYSVNERPNALEIPLGVSIKQAGEYSIQGIRMDIAMGIRDNWDGTLYDLTNGAFTFYAEPGQFEDRYTLVQLDGETNSIERLKEETGVEVKITDNGIWTSGNVAVFNLAGKEMTQGVQGRIELAAGTYIVKAGNASAKVYLKK